MKHLIILLFLPFIGYSQISDDSLRLWYTASVESEKLSQSMIDYLDTLPEKSALQYAFLASAQALMGKHAFNPYYKLDYVKQCQGTFDIAIAKSPSNPEIRFMRLAVEHYVPSFLGYSKHVDEDLSFLYSYLVDNQKEKKDETIYLVIKNFIIETERLSEEQKKKLVASN